MRGQGGTVGHAQQASSLHLGIWHRRDRIEEEEAEPTHYRERGSAVAAATNRQCKSVGGFSTA